MPKGCEMEKHNDFTKSINNGRLSEIFSRV